MEYKPFYKINSYLRDEIIQKRLKQISINLTSVISVTLPDGEVIQSH